MALVGRYVLWIIFFSIGITFVYRTGLRIERQWPIVGLLYFVLLGQGVLVASGLAAYRVTAVRQASCEEREPNSDRLNGSSLAEFRERCAATLD
jgi:hypothetical protein